MIILISIPWIILYMKMECLSAIHKAQEKTPSSTTKKKQKESRMEINNNGDTTFYTYVYNQHGQLTDFIKESHDISIFYGDAPTWNDTRGNKIHIRYSNFDKHGNWTKSYFITEKRRLLYSKRKIKYW